MRRVGSVALPAFETQLGVTGAVAAVGDHVEDVLLRHAALQRPSLADVVVWAVDVQVVVDIDLHRESLPPESEIKTQTYRER